MSKKQSISLSPLFERLGHSFKQVDLLEKALCHRSSGSKNNERLEFLGDSILGFIIGSFLFKRFPNAKEGELTRMRASLVNQEAIANCAKDLDLGSYLQLGPGEKRTGGFQRDSILADALEAVIGAIYLDSDIYIAELCILKWYKKKLEQGFPKKIQKDAKTQLQELLQAKKMPLPQYQVVSIEGDDHEQLFKIKCLVSLLDEPVFAEGSSRRRAEQQAAKNVLELLNRE